MAIFVTSDLHFGHDREFVWGARGYADVEEMNREQIRKFNEVVGPEDEVWILGDLMLGDREKGIECVKQLNGKIHICLGNHDTGTREKLYNELGFDVQLAARFKYKKLNFYLSHFPTDGTNLNVENIWETNLCLYGHTHQTGNFYKGNPYIYHVGVDSHDGYPVSMDQVIADIKAEMERCKELLYEKEDLAE